MRFIIIFLLFNGVGIKDVYAVNKSTKAKTKLFTSEKGYKISYPDCMQIVPDSAYDEGKKVESLENITIFPTKCEDKLIFKGNKTIYGIDIYDFEKMSFEVGLNNIKNNTIASKARGGANYILSYEPPIEQNKMYKLITIEHSGFLRWNFYLPCKAQMFVFTIMTKNDIEVSKDYISKLKRADFSDLKTELSIIDSFECTK